MTSASSSFTPSACVVVCRDGPNGPSGRATATKEHMAYIETVLGELNNAGPLYDPSGKTMIGSVYSFRTTSLEHARELVENDPYFRAGVFASVEIFPHLPAAGEYIGGKIW